MIFTITSVKSAYIVHFTSQKKHERLQKNESFEKYCD